jgi:hypothetical protein
MRGLMLVMLVVAQFTIVPFIGMMDRNKAPQFHVAGQTIIYKSN